MALWNKVSYHRRLFAGLVAYSVLMLICFGLLQYSREKDFKADELNDRLQIINQELLYRLEHSDTIPSQISLSEYPFKELRVSVIDPKGYVLYDNSLDSLPLSNHLERPEIARAIAVGEGFSLRRASEETGTEYFYSARKGEKYIVRTAVPYSTSLDSLLKADYTFLWVMGAITLALCVIGYFVTRRLGQNVTRLNIFAERAERGERIYESEPFPHDELGEISSHIVRLYARLQQTTLERNREHQRALEAQQEKIRIKHQLTNNINHELKTPVAAMQLCLETLVNHDNLPAEKRREFLNRCLQANERLTHLLSDVAAITRLDDGGQAIPRCMVDIAAIASESVADMELAASGKRIEIHNNLPASIMIEGNETLLASIFHNLIENAIAYSGGTLVEISMLEKTDKDVTIRISDNGNGVADEHLPHLFERFYRVDKGRSRKLGNTGLGLAIVKNAVIWHGGEISVIKKPSGGLSFTFRLSL